MTNSVADSVTSVMLALLSLYQKAKSPLGYDSSGVASIFTSILQQDLPQNRGHWTQANEVMSYFSQRFASAQRQQHHQQTSKLQILHTYKKSVVLPLCH